MPNRNLWNRNVPRVEYDHRARDIRLRLEHSERLPVKRDAVGSFWYFGQLLLLLGNIAGNSRRTGSSNNQRPYHTGVPRQKFTEILSLITPLRAPPAST